MPFENFLTVVGMPKPIDSPLLLKGIHAEEYCLVSSVVFNPNSPSRSSAVVEVS